jgi:hypothetical protein
MEIEGIINRTVLCVSKPANYISQLNANLKIERLVTLNVNHYRKQLLAYTCNDSYSIDSKNVHLNYYFCNDYCLTCGVPINRQRNTFNMLTGYFNNHYNKMNFNLWKVEWDGKRLYIKIEYSDDYNDSYIEFSGHIN